MTTPEAANMQKASAILRALNKQHKKTAALMAIPLLAGFACAQFAPPVLGSIAIALAPAAALTIGLALIPTDFRTRTGSLTPAICLVAALWLCAAVGTAFSLIERP